MLEMTSLRTFTSVVAHDLADGEEHTYLCVQDETEVSYGSARDCDLDYCEEHSIPVFDRTGAGGCIVHAKGNVEAGAIYDNSVRDPFVCQWKFVRDFSEYLRGRGLNVSNDGNDVLVDGYKVASAAGSNLPPDFRRTCEVIQISVNQDLDLIEKVCEKPMVKVPKGLSDFGVTTEEVRAWLSAWMAETFD